MMMMVMMMMIINMPFPNKKIWRYIHSSKSSKILYFPYQG